MYILSNVSNISAASLIDLHYVNKYKVKLVDLIIDIYTFCVIFPKWIRRTITLGWWRIDIVCDVRCVSQR